MERKFRRYEDFLAAQKELQDKLDGERARRGGAQAEGKEPDEVGLMAPPLRCGNNLFLKPLLAVLFLCRTRRRCLAR